MGVLWGCGSQGLFTVAINDYNVEVKLTMIDVTIDLITCYLSTCMGLSLRIHQRCGVVNPLNHTMLK